MASNVTMTVGITFRWWFKPMIYCYVAWLFISGRHANDKTIARITRHGVRFNFDA